MESLSRVAFLLLATVIFQLFSSATVVEAREAVSPGSSTNSKKWCVAKNGAPDVDLKKNLDWACGLSDVDCRPIQPGGGCSEEGTVKSRASFAMNSYYRKHETKPDACDFSGTAEITDNDPRTEPGFRGGGGQPHGSVPTFT
ncbi:hypothetical protein V6N13_121956 [Hibiscus sabdariffa]|uniref:X8 domain-containing protein n=2 Tax=Hibiscus sabdariffa TaxID=183260 RepID=A0ABR2A589_9ROSI